MAIPAKISEALELQQKLWEAVKAISATTATLDDLLMIPKAYLSELMSEIREFEDRMQGLKHESAHVLKEKEQELSEKLLSIQIERRSERSLADEKYDSTAIRVRFWSWQISSYS